MPTDELRIRSFSTSDLSRILEIERTSFITDAFSEAEFRRWYRKCPDLFIVAEISGLLVGDMVTCVLPDKGDIVSIAVDPSYRRRGIGKALTSFTFHRLKTLGTKVVELEVRPTNVEGLRFWKSLGFVPIGLISDFYRDGAAALRMTRSL